MNEIYKGVIKAVRAIDSHRIIIVPPVKLSDP